MSKILVIGSRGSMGARYMAILRYMKEEAVGVDLGDKWPDLHSGDRVIIASPTSDHLTSLAYLMDILQFRGDVLCEKPIVKDAATFDWLPTRAKLAGVDVRMVSNWIYALNRALLGAGEVAVKDEMEIEYNFFHSGNDGFFWDCIQPIYLAGRFKYNRNSPFFECKVNGNPVTLDDFGRSYAAMISEWIHGDKRRLWSLEDAQKATWKVLSAMGHDPEPVAGEIDFRGQG